MAKMFYTLDEAKAALGKSEDEIKQYTREGRLREFRDGPRLMFKADQIESLKAQLGGGSGIQAVDLGPSDSGAPIGLVDSRGGSGSAIGLAPDPARAAWGADYRVFPAAGWEAELAVGSGAASAAGWPVVRVRA